MVYVTTPETGPTLSAHTVTPGVCQRKVLSNRNLLKEFAMARDLSAQFQQLRSGRKRASDQLKPPLKAPKTGWRLTSQAPGSVRRRHSG